jgi:hypothetical protein
LGGFFNFHLHPLFEVFLKLEILPHLDFPEALMFLLLGKEVGDIVWRTNGRKRGIQIRRGLEEEGGGGGGGRRRGKVKLPPQMKLYSSSRRFKFEVTLLEDDGEEAPDDHCEGEQVVGEAQSSIGDPDNPVGLVDVKPAGHRSFLLCFLFSLGKRSDEIFIDSSWECSRRWNQNKQNKTKTNSSFKKWI